MIRISTSPDSYPSELSGGTQQKTAVARALMSDAKLLLFDEPLGALDVKVRTELRYELRKLVKDLKLTALHVTHDQEEAMSISDRVIVMRKGRIIEKGPPLNLFTNPQNIFTANFVGETNFLTGTIKEKRKKGSIIEVGETIQLLTEKEDVKTGDLVVIAFRPEFVSINGKEKTNNFLGIVENVLYSGSIMRIMVKLSNDEIITVKKPITHKGPIINLKDTIKVHISPEKIFVYEYPETGLLEELALE
jgi:ABC-type Fe3+/spermidine/putrescine transport system ATPase subunit